MPVLPILAVLVCLFVAGFLPLDTWFKFLGCMAIGLPVYFLYGKRHSRLARNESTDGYHAFRESENRGGPANLSRQAWSRAIRRARCTATRP